ncbi:hypothetical protein ACFO4E_18400 [Nocardiopsis mangrovi]|uniref:Chaplin domain-containing protein n=1 Tax=Nocardiopsis mangrovi TaxID=1179818 RepID=A0ABV9E0W8_9ACTN
MPTWVRTSARAALLTAGFVALGAGVSYADSSPSTSGNGSLLGGNQLLADLDVPVNAAGNAIGVLGNAGASADRTAALVAESTEEVSTSGNGSLLGGNQAVIDADVPVNAVGNAIAVLGNAGADADSSGAAVVEEDDHHHDHHHGHHHGHHGHGHEGGPERLHDRAESTEREHQLSDADVLAQVDSALATTEYTVAQLAPKPPVFQGGDYVTHQSAPAAPTTDLSSIAEAASGLTRPLEIQPGALQAGPTAPQSAPAEQGTAEVVRQSAPGHHGHGHEGHHGHDGREVSTSGNASLLGGNQAVIDADVPVNLAGNAIGAIGSAGASADRTAALVAEDGEDVSTSGNASLLGGNQLVADLDVPVNAVGNAIAVLGNAGAAGNDSGAAVIEHQRAENGAVQSNTTGVEHHAAAERGAEGGLPELPAPALPAPKVRPLAAEQSPAAPAASQPQGTNELGLPEVALEDVPVVRTLPAPTPEAVAGQARMLSGELSGLADATEGQDADPLGPVTGALGL